MNKPIFPGIPRLPNRPKDVGAISEILEVGLGSKGDGRNRFVRVSDLAEIGVAQIKRLQRGNTATFQLAPPQAQNVDIPTRPTNFTAVGGFTHIILTWDYPNYNGHAHTEIWRSSTDDFGSAVRIQTNIGSIAEDTVDYGSQLYYWVRHVNVNSVVGPLNATAGTYAQSSPNISQVISDLSDELNETHLAQSLRSRIDLIDAPTIGLVSQAAGLASELSEEVSDRVADVVVLQGQIDSLTTNTNVQIFYQAAMPAGTYADGSRWFDTDDGNHPYIWGAGAWQDARDLSIAAVQSNLSQETINRISADDAQVARLDSLELTTTNLSTGTAANASATSLLDARVVNTETSTTVNASDITSLQTTVFDPTNGVGAHTTALSGLDSRVTVTEGAISANASDVTLLETTLSQTSTGVNANTSALNSLDSRLTSNESETTANVSDISALEATVNNPVTGVGANASAVTGLDSRVTVTENAAIATASDVSSIQSSITGLNSGISTNAAAVSGIDSRVTVNEAEVISQASEILALESSVNNPVTGLSATATYVANVELRVTSTENATTSQATNISQLTTASNNQTATIQTHQSSLDGLTAQWDVKTQVGDLVGGIGLYNDGSETQFMVNADVFAVLDNDGDSVNPFFITGGSVYMDTAYIQNGSIQVGQIETLTVDDITGYTSSFVLSTIGTGQITNAYISNIIQSNNFSAGNAGWRIDKNGQIEAHSITIYDGSNVVLSSGGGMEWSYVSGSARPADNADVTAGNPQNANWLTNSVVGDHNQISSANISTYIAGAAIGYAQIGTAAVDTLTIADQAVSAVAIGETLTPRDLYNPPSPGGYSDYTDGASRNITVLNASSGTVILITCSAEIHWNVRASDPDSGDSISLHMEVVRDGVAIKSSEIYRTYSRGPYFDEDKNIFISYPLTDSPGNGAFTYSVRFRAEADTSFSSVIDSAVNKSSVILHLAYR